MRDKYTAKWGVQLAGMIFQTRFSVPCRQKGIDRPACVTALLCGWKNEQKSTVVIISDNNNGIYGMFFTYSVCFFT